MVADPDIEGTFLDVQVWDQILWGLIVLAGALMVIVVTPSAVGWVLSPSHRPPEPAPRGGESAADAAGSAGAPDPDTLDDRPVAQRGGLSKVRPRVVVERRKYPRRNGAPTPVLLSDGGDGDTPVLCSVINRGRGGLGIVVDRPYQAGALLSVRPVGAPADVPWVRVEVRNCRRRGLEWCVGCRFTQELPWGVVLLFG